MMQFTGIFFIDILLDIFIAAMFMCLLVIGFLLRRGARTFVRVQKGQNEVEYRATEDDFMLYWKIGTGSSSNRSALKMSFPRLRVRGGYLDRLFYVIEGDIYTTTVLTIQDKMTEAGNLDEEKVKQLLNECAVLVDMEVEEKKLSDEEASDLMSVMVKEKITEAGIPEGMYSIFTQQVTSLNLLKDILSGIGTNKWLVIGSFIFGIVVGALITLLGLLYMLGGVGA